MERVNETSPVAEFVDLGSVSEETRGPIANGVDTVGEGRQLGISDD